MVQRVSVVDKLYAAGTFVLIALNIGVAHHHRAIPPFARGLRVGDAVLRQEIM